MPSISVIIPTYKGSKNLKRAIDSVLNQTFNDFEIIIVDDNNPGTEERKKTEDILSTYHSVQVRYIQHGCNKNGAAARNTGIKNTFSKYITFLDDDDFMFPNRLKVCYEYLENNHEFGGVVGGVLILDGAQIVEHILYNSELTVTYMLCSDIALGTGSNIFLKRDCANSVNGFDETFTRHQDREFMIRVLKYNRIGYVCQDIIVKGQNDNSNIPDYKKLKTIKEKFCKKFINEINKLTLDDRKLFYIDMKNWLFYTALDSKNKEDLNDAVFELQKYKKLTLKDYLKILFFKLNMYPIYKMLKKIGMKFLKPSTKMDKEIYNMYLGRFIR